MDGDSLYVLVCEQLSDEIIAEHDDFIFDWCHSYFDRDTFEHSIDFDVEELVDQLLKQLP